jgi:hypothetical protein
MMTTNWITPYNSTPGDIALRVGKLVALGACAGAVMTVARGKTDPMHIVSGGARIATVLGLFGATKTAAELTLPQHPTATSLLSGGVAVFVPNAVFTSRAEILQKIFEAQSGRKPTRISVLAYSAISGAVLLGGTDLIARAIGDGRGI